MRRLLWLAVFACLVAVPAMAQDPVKVDPKHYKVVFENDQVRVLHIHYGPHEKSVMHEHPNGVVTFLADERGKFTFPDGKSEEFVAKAGESQWIAGGKHLPENTGNTPLDGVLVELKGKMAAKPAAKAPPAAKKKGS